MAETSKANERRQREGFFKTYCKGNGIDIGVGSDPLLPDVDVWDKPQGEAEWVHSIQSNMYDFAYSSHCLEHIKNPILAVLNWYRIVKSGGFLIVVVPHRDLYEKKKELPSRWNGDHKFFFLPENHEPPHTLGLRALIGGALYQRRYKLHYIKECNENFVSPSPLHHSGGEYSIEAVIEKLDTCANIPLPSTAISPKKGCCG